MLMCKFFMKILKICQVKFINILPIFLLEKKLILKYCTITDVRLLMFFRENELMFFREYEQNIMCIGKYS